MTMVWDGARCRSMPIRPSSRHHSEYFRFICMSRIDEIPASTTVTVTPSHSQRKKFTLIYLRRPIYHIFIQNIWEFRYRIILASVADCLHWNVILLLLWNLLFCESQQKDSFESSPHPFSGVFQLIKLENEIILLIIHHCSKTMMNFQAWLLRFLIFMQHLLSFLVLGKGGSRGGGHYSGGTHYGSGRHYNNGGAYYNNGDRYGSSRALQSWRNWFLFLCFGIIGGVVVFIAWIYGVCCFAGRAERKLSGFESHIEEATGLVQRSCADNPYPLQSSPVSGIYDVQYREGFRTFHSNVDMRFSKTSQGWSIQGKGWDADGQFRISYGLVSHAGMAYWVENQMDRSILSRGRFLFDSNLFMGNWRSSNGRSGSYEVFRFIGGYSNGQNLKKSDNPPKKSYNPLRDELVTDPEMPMGHPSIPVVSAYCPPITNAPTQAASESSKSPIS